MVGYEMGTHFHTLVLVLGEHIDSADAFIAQPRDEDASVAGSHHDDFLGIRWEATFLVRYHIQLFRYCLHVN